MTVPTDQELTDRWRDELAPLLPMLHAFHERDGFLSEGGVAAVSAALRIPVAELYGSITFYHHFSRQEPGEPAPAGLGAPRVCTGPICNLNGAQKLLADLNGKGATSTSMPCAGRCDEPIPVIEGSRVMIATGAAAMEEKPSPLPAPNPGKEEECVFAAIREPDRATIQGYERSGGYEGLRRIIAEQTARDIVQLIKDSGLAGRGGAGFPTGVKWDAVAKAQGSPKTIVCNADEGEPGCFKDRVILDHDPHTLIEGMLTAALATGATRGFIYLRYEYPHAQGVLERAIAEAEDAGLLGDNILNSGSKFHLYVRRGAGAYICGEEGSLLNSLEGKHPFPRNRPPFPVTHGYENLPTVVNNVETLASVPHITRHGAEWYKGLGRGDQTGTKVISLSGDVQRPGNYEVPLGLPLQTLIHEWAGGPKPDRSIQAVTMAGLSGGFLAGDDLDVTLDEPSIKSKGSFLGAGGIMVFDDSRDMVSIAHQAMEFFAEESCGKCFPCRIGTQRLTERLAGSAGPKDLDGWIDEVTDIGHAMKATSACGLGMAAPLVTESLLRYFPKEVADHVAR